MTPILLVLPDNPVYLRVAFGDSLHRGEVPCLAGLALGIEGNPAYCYDKAVVYNDYGVTDDMACVIDLLIHYGLKIEYRRLLDGSPPAFSTVPPNKPLTTSHAVDTVHV
jgi:hypothetical protein